MGPFFANGIITRLVEKNFPKLSIHRISSYVIEKFIVVTKPHDLKRLLTHLKQNGKIYQIKQNKYGLIVLTKISNTFNWDL